MSVGTITHNGTLHTHTHTQLPPLATELSGDTGACQHLFLMLMVHINIAVNNIATSSCRISFFRAGYQAIFCNLVLLDRSHETVTCCGCTYIVPAVLIFQPVCSHQPLLDGSACLYLFVHDCMFYLPLCLSFSLRRFALKKPSCCSYTSTTWQAPFKVRTRAVWC